MKNIIFVQHLRKHHIMTSDIKRERICSPYCWEISIQGDGYIDFNRGRLLIVQNNKSKLKKIYIAKRAKFFSINMSDEPSFCFTFKSSKSAVVLCTSLWTQWHNGTMAPGTFLFSKTLCVV